MRGLLPVLVLVTSWAFAAAPKATAPKPLPGLRSPLGRIGDIVQPVQPGGIPAGEQVVTLRFPGCGMDQQIAVSRFLFLGAARAAEQVETWLNAQPEVKTRLFGSRADPLAEALGQARAARFVEGRACDPKTRAPLPLVSGGRLTLLRAPAVLCPLNRRTRTSGGSGVWLYARAIRGATGPGDFAAAVAVSGAEGRAEAAGDLCRPKLSAVLFDARGQTRFAYHADYNGAVEAVVFGQRCRQLQLRFDPGSQQFLPVPGRTPGCGAKPPRHQ